MKKLENFRKALENLRDIYTCEEPYSNIELAGCVQLYEVCFELAWKAMKEKLQDEGFPEARTGSPKQVLKTAYEAGMITEEESWLAALADRNNVAHAYEKNIALGIVRNTKARYVRLFETLLETMEAEMREDA